MKLTELARVVRSKNAGPTTLTIDLMFADADAYNLARKSTALSAAAIAPLYGVPTQRVQVIPYEPAWAIKIVLDRRVIAGSPGDTDVYGAQQHGPLLGIEL
jgi:hypothetical protein